MGLRKSPQRSENMNEEFEVVGLVQHKNEDKAKGKYGIKISERWYNGFGALPNYVAEGAKIKLRYFEKQVGDKTYYNVVDGGISQADEDEAETPAPKGVQTQIETGKDYKSADNIDHVTDVVDSRAIVWGKCYEAIEKVLNRKLEVEETASVNSLFIEVCKHLK
jgi:hypothetical protein